MPRFAGWKPALACLVLLAATTHTRVGSWNDSARMASIESLVLRHTFAIDDSTFRTADSIRIGDRFYSNKQPLMEVAGAALLLPLNRLLGVELRFREASAGYYLLTLLLVGVPTAFAVALLDRWFRRRGFAPVDRRIAVAGFAVATLFWPYSTVFNNHTLAGALLLLGAIVLAADRPMTPGRAVVAGLALGFSATIDLPTAAFFIPAYFVYLLVQPGRAAAAWFVAGLVLPLASQLALQLLISGDFLPTNLHREYWRYPGSPWVHATISGEFAITSFGEGITYAFHSLVGRRGFLSYSPFLLWGLAGLVTTARSSRTAERGHAIATLAGLALTAVYLILFATQYGGLNYGDRYFVGLTGVIVAFTARGFWTQAPRGRRGLLAAALVFSFAVAALGALANPFLANTPLSAAKVVLHRW